MAGGPEDHFTDGRDLHVLVEGDEQAHVEALDRDAGYRHIGRRMHLARRHAAVASRPFLLLPEAVA
jgi:hypothetical protein